MESRNDFMFRPFGPGGQALPVPGDAPSLDDFDSDDPLRFFKYINAGAPGHLPMPKLMEADEVRRLCNERSSSVLAHYDRLQRILDRHESTIQKRWTKKTKQQRLRILLDGWPNMAPMHRPDFDAFRRETEAQRDAGTKFRDRFMWPYINQEDLLRPKSLLLMLKSRGRHHPCEFAAADGDAMYLGRLTKALVPIFLNCYVVTLNGMTRPEEYGALVAWEDHPDAFEWMHTRRQFLPGEALDILEAQDRLMKFLVHCCEQLLHDIPAAELIGDKYPVQPEPPLKSGVEPDGLDSLAVMAEEAPYRPPGRLDFGRIESLLAARSSAAEDHLWALREDPSYFSNQLLIYKEHRQEMMKDTNGKPHPILQPLKIGVFWERVIGNVLLSAHVELEIFAELRRQAEELKRLQLKYAGTLSPHKDLPDDYLFGILRFRYFLSQLAKEWLNDLKTTVVASPPMRSLFVRLPAEDLNKIIVTMKPGLKQTAAEKELVWLLRTLWEDGEALFFARMPMIADELERLLRAEPRVKDMISGYVAGRIGDLSILCECLRQLDIYQPWANGYENHMVDREEDIKEEMARWRAGWFGIRSTMKSKPMLATFALADPSDKKFHYPAEKRRTKETVEALRQAEANLDAFWEKFDKCLKPGDVKRTALRELLSQNRTLQRTAEWTAPAPTKPSKPAVVSPEDDVIYRPLSTLYFELGASSSTTKLDPIAQPKTKVKTRGTPSQQQQPQQQQQQQQQQQLADAVAALDLDTPQPPAPIPVDARALKVFRTLFFHPAVTSTPGEVAWPDFLHAMAAAGFRAEKLYGSVWHLQPVAPFHEPHPAAKIPFHVARRMGRRLARAYGWFGGLFVLKEK
ncbi:uncharacterized protein THITE_2081075 [Thermothielavioides terrestris NRRL 8126]|uniref:Uncharacterized protein n=1 Tax=Thermothielavioides terrestris (strain ATCC 38088 / NRRL 8126) TaxID=578455 RepID=G2RD85_THETT|nr:uncharacterized protein THITE_2081075 [Thermothielavioides terrestris NRRL 8126]AEO69920.1 hypothetical protein THITE_2081075 [Thermothielavioides terrestris NRRL 8126]